MYLSPHVYVQSFRAGEVLPHGSIDHQKAPDLVRFLRAYDAKYT